MKPKIFKSKYADTEYKLIGFVLKSDDGFKISISRTEFESDFSPVYPDNGWMDISTAPADIELQLAVRWSKRIRIGSFSSIKQVWFSSETGAIISPELWQPLPELPTLQGESA